jgi:hypothetical protein
MCEHTVVTGASCVCDVGKSTTFIYFLLSHGFQISCEIIYERPVPNVTNLYTISVFVSPGTRG